MNPPQPALFTLRDLLRGLVWLALGLFLACQLAQWLPREWHLLSPFLGQEGVPAGSDLDEHALRSLLYWYAGVLLLFMQVEGSWRLRRRLLLHDWQCCARCCTVSSWLPALLLLLLLPVIVIPCAAEALEKANGEWRPIFGIHAVEGLVLWLGVAITFLLLGLSRYRRADSATDIEPEARHSLPGLMWEALLLVLCAPLVLLVLATTLLFVAASGLLEWLLALLIFCPENAHWFHNEELLLTAWCCLVGASFGALAWLALLHQGRRCFGRRWLRRAASVLVGAAAAAACLCAVAAAVRAVMQSADPQALAFYGLLTLHFLALSAALPWVWWWRGCALN